MFNIFPKKCLFCGLPSGSTADLCLECKRSLPWKLTTNNISSQFIHDTVAVFGYNFPIQQLVIGLKFTNKFLYGRILGELMAEYLQHYYHDKSMPQVIIPVPLHRNRLQYRGFNQVLELAGPIAKRLLLPLDLELCERIKNTRAQSELAANKRSKNIKDAFRVKDYLPYKHIAILDDVITTGSTMIELCKVINSSGIEKIDVWCCAKTEDRDQ